MSIDVSKLSITSRDYLSIFKELQEAVPNLTDLWTCSNENDPGVVLVKLMAMYGDMLSYNLDRATLELYASSVQQRSNAQKIFALIGYKMHWYKSAICEAYLSNINENIVNVPKLTTFVTQDKSIPYVYFGDADSEDLNIDRGEVVKVPLVQGRLNAPPKLTSNVLPGLQNKWHSIYDFNITDQDIINDNYIYLNDNKIDQDHIYLVDDFGYTWLLVDSVDTQMSSGRFFEFNVDNKDEAYIKLVQYWRDFNVSRFKLFTLSTLGEEGQIYVNALSETATSKIVRRTNEGTEIDVTRDVIVTNEPSTRGYNYELPDEAREVSKNYINTYDTLVTIDDFTRATRRLTDIVSNCKVTDATIDPYNYISERSESDPAPLSEFNVRIYVTVPEGIVTSVDTLKADINTALKRNKLMPLSIDVNTANINYYGWEVRGYINLTEAVTIDTAQSILVDINNMLKFNYDCSKIDYNSTVTYYDVINTMKEANNYISSIDLGPISYYRLVDGEKTGPAIDQSEITAQYEYIPTSTGPDINQIHVELGNTPILPKSVIVRINGSQYTLYDSGATGSDGSGVTGNFNTKSSIIGNTNYINYNNGTITIDLNRKINPTAFTISYKKNVINMVKFLGVTEDLRISQNYIKE